MDEVSVACEYRRDRGQPAQVVLRVSTLEPFPPAVKTSGMIVKAPSDAKATNYRNKRWSVALEGEDIIGMIFSFTKVDRVDHSDRSKGQIAMLKFAEQFGGVPVGAQLCVPLDCICKFERV